uniref:NADH dehydrogenase [ubiquinone] 1 beta subcomplex subunit 10 n=1 Tax=Salvator merianae TaxID=96440 RepID=A0A8D0DTZ5_SALMN
MDWSIDWARRAKNVSFCLQQLQSFPLKLSELPSCRARSPLQSPACARATGSLPPEPVSSGKGAAILFSSPTRSGCSGRGRRPSLAMPGKPDPAVYPEAPSRTPVPNPQSSIGNPLDVVQKIFNYTVDAPVTALREWVERNRAKHKTYYYHQVFRRVPDYTECLEEDYLCFFEAEVQWKRDKKVDEEIVKIMQQRLRTCKIEEGENFEEKCQPQLEQLKAATKAYQDRYGDLGAYGNARTCLMKQKQRMLAERKAKAAAAHMEA